MKDDERAAPQLPSRPSSGNEASPELRGNPHRDDKKPGRDPLRKPPTPKKHPQHSREPLRCLPARFRAALATGNMLTSGVGPFPRRDAATLAERWKTKWPRRKRPVRGGAERGRVGNVGAQWRREGASSLRLSESGGKLRSRERAGEEGSSPPHGLGSGPRQRPGKAAAAVRKAVRTSRRRLQSQCQDGRVV